jgi:hypothetical protein
MYGFQALLCLPNLAKVTSEPYVFAIPIPATSVAMVGTSGNVISQFLLPFFDQEG